MIEIETLREKNTPDEIETMLLNGELGEIRLGSSGYQFIDGILVSHLVIEIHEPGFIENRTKDIVVHHKDANPLNNVYINLKVTTIAEHVRMHETDPKYAEAEKARRMRLSAYYTDPANAEDIEARYDKVSRSMIAYLTSSVNVDVIKTRSRKQSKSLSMTLRKRWLPLETFLKAFTADEYAKASRVSCGTAARRLAALFKEGKIACEKQLIDSRWCNIYRRKKECLS